MAEGNPTPRAETGPDTEQGEASIDDLIEQHNAAMPADAPVLLYDIPNGVLTSHNKTLRLSVASQQLMLQLLMRIGDRVPIGDLTLNLQKPLRPPAALTYLSYKMTEALGKSFLDLGLQDVCLCPHHRLNISNESRAENIADVDAVPSPGVGGETLQKSASPKPARRPRGSGSASQIKAPGGPIVIPHRDITPLGPSKLPPRLAPAEIAPFDPANLGAAFLRIVNLEEVYAARGPGRRSRDITLMSDHQLVFNNRSIDLHGDQLRIFNALLRNLGRAPLTIVQLAELAFEGYSRPAPPRFRVSSMLNSGLRQALRTKTYPLFYAIQGNSVSDRDYRLDPTTTIIDRRK